MHKNEDDEVILWLQLQSRHGVPYGVVENIKPEGVESSGFDFSGQAQIFY